MAVERFRTTVLLGGKTAKAGAAAYVCEKGTCHAPVTTAEAVRGALTGNG